MQGCSGDAHGFGNRDPGNLFLQEYADLFLLAVELGLAQRALGVGGAVCPWPLPRPALPWTGVVENGRFLATRS